MVGTRPVEGMMIPFMFCGEAPCPSGLTSPGNHFVRSGLKVMKQAMTMVPLVSTHDQMAMVMLSKVKSVLLAVRMSMYSRMMEMRQMLAC